MSVASHTIVLLWSKSHHCSSICSRQAGSQSHNCSWSCQ